jgi:hypothetical protein
LHFARHFVAESAGGSVLRHAVAVVSWAIQSGAQEVKMTKVQEIQTVIESLPREEYVRLRQWFSERDWDQWDKQIEADSEAGKLDFLIKEAFDEKARGLLRGL